MTEELPAGETGGPGPAGAEAADANRRRAAEVEESRAALEAQAPPELRTGSTEATPAGGSDDARSAAEHARQAAANRQALEDQARRTSATLPPDLRVDRNPGS